MQMSDKDFISELTKIFKENSFGALLNSQKSEKLLLLTKRMLEENERYNLTAITEPSKIILNHYADCATLSKQIAKGASIIDVGCGAGFPSLPLAILREDLNIFSIDSTSKRINYVKETAKMLGLNNISAESMRAEDGAKNEIYREKFDYATARAVAEMRVLCELCLPYVKVGGKMIAMKGKNAEFELSSSKKALAILGNAQAKIEKTFVKSGEDCLEHALIVVSKKAKTPQAYPRPYAQISKKPL